MLENIQTNKNEAEQLPDQLPANDSTNAQPFNNQEDLSEEKAQSSFGMQYAAIQATIETSLIILGLILVVLLLPRDTGGDGWVRYQDLLSSITHRNLFNPGSRYSLIGPFFSIPLLYIGKKLGDSFTAICLYNFTLFCFCLLATYFLLRNYVDRGLLRKFFLVLTFASMFVAHLALYYGEVFTALCVGLGVLIAFTRFTSIAGWIAVALGVANTPATLLGLGLVVLKRSLDSKRLRYILVFGIAGICILAESWIRRGSIFSNGYSNDHGFKTIMPFSGLPGFSYPFLFGLLALLFSFGKGLLFFTPGLLLPIRKTIAKWLPDQQINMYQVYTLWICFLVGLIFVYSRWWAWSGAVFWGPRFMLFASIPASFALAVRLIRYKDASLSINMLTLIVFYLSAWVSVDGAVFQWVVTNPSVCGQNNSALEVLCWFTPDYSALWMPFVFHLQIDRAQKIFLIFSLLVAMYIGTPLFIHILKQIGELAKKYAHEYLNIKLWHI